MYYNQTTTRINSSAAVLYVQLKTSSAYTALYWVEVTSVFRGLDCGDTTWSGLISFSGCVCWHFILALTLLSSVKRQSYFLSQQAMYIWRLKDRFLHSLTATFISWFIFVWFMYNQSTCWLTDQRNPHSYVCSHSIRNQPLTHKSTGVCVFVGHVSLNSKPFICQSVSSS